MVLDFLALYFIIVTHFTNYIIYIGFTKIFPDLVVSFGLLFVFALMLTGLLQAPSVILRTGIFSLLIIIVLSDAIFEFGTTEGGARLNISILAMIVTLGSVYFLRQHINKILIAVFIAMFASTVVLNLPLLQQDASETTAPSTGRDDLPVIVHLVLDEHMGSGGMTGRLPEGERIREELTAFYLRNKFRLFSRAYSEYFDTHIALASLLNAGADETPPGYAVMKRNKYVLTKNGYFEEWARNGYEINVLQSSYFDLCTNASEEIRNCTTYNHDSFDEDAISSLPLTDRIVLMGNMYYSSFTLFKLVQLSEKTLRRYLRENYDLSLPDFGLWHGWVGPLAVSSPLNRLIRDVSRSNGGELFFAHLLIPHYPYVYESSCQVRTPVSTWQVRSLDDGTNTPGSRRARYTDYFDQIRCTMRKLQPLFDAMKEKGTFDKAIIIIHGDHGARITRINPEAGNARQMTGDDYIDGFSTLFALKAPGVAPGTDERMAPLPRLLAYATDRREEGLLENIAPYVYLSDGGDEYVRTPIPEFPLVSE